MLHVFGPSHFDFLVNENTTRTGAAWHLSSSPNVMVTVLEAEGRAGGHAHTVDVTLDGKTVPVDTG